MCVCVCVCVCARIHKILSQSMMRYFPGRYIWGLYVRVNLLSFVLLAWGRRRWPYFTWFKPTCPIMLFSLGAQGRDREGLASVSGEARGGAPARTHFLLSTFQAWLGSWAVALLRLPGKLWGFSACVFRAGLFCAARSPG